VKVRYTETALAEVDQILSYIAERNRAAANAVRARIEATVAALGETPEMAQKSDEPGVRRMLVGSYPYLIFYTIHADEVVILHVRHGARRLPWDDE
jgi:toxin ParE1/3/4